MAAEFPNGNAPLERPVSRAPPTLRGPPHRGGHHRLHRFNPRCGSCVAFAATVITGLVLWNLVGNLPLPLGVAVHEGSTILVALNGPRLLRPGAWTTAGRTN